MTDVQGSAATGSTPPASSPPVSGASGAYSDTAGSSGANGVATTPSAPGLSSPAWSQAGTAAVQSSFLSEPPAEQSAQQPPPLFRGASLVPVGSSLRTATEPVETSLAALADDTSHLAEGDILDRFDRLVEGDPDPHSVRQFFTALSPADRERLADERAREVGHLDGAPAALRDQANRLLMAADLDALKAKEEAGTLSRQELRVLENVRAVQESIAKIEEETDLETGENLVSQLYVYEPFAFGGDGRMAVAVGDLDRADHVAAMVPGLGANVAGITGGGTLNVYRDSRAAGVENGDTIAVLDWVGYDAPSGGPFRGDVAGVVTQSMAREGAQRLAADVAGLREMRGVDRPHLTVIGHSYGSTTAAIAAHEFGLAADDLILTGSPGAGGAVDAADLTTGRDHTWVGSASRDFVTSLGVTGWMDPLQVIAGAHGIPSELLGSDPAEDDFYAQRFQAEHVDRGNGWNLNDHIDRYYERGTESLYSVAAVVAARYERVVRAEPRRDPWYAPLQDPERERMPQEMSH